jgi:uncharacterized protein
MLKQLVEYIVKQLVDKPELIIVTEKLNGDRMSLEIRVASQDLKRVIGKEGRVVRAIRTVVNCFEPRENIEIVLDSIQQ